MASVRKSEEGKWSANGRGYSLTIIEYSPALTS